MATDEVPNTTIGVRVTTSMRLELEEKARAMGPGTTLSDALRRILLRDTTRERELELLRGERDRAVADGEKRWHDLSSRLETQGALLVTLSRRLLEIEEREKERMAGQPPKLKTPYIHGLYGPRFEIPQVSPINQGN